jgi:hypothetical protein
MSAMTEQALYGAHDCARYECAAQLSGCRYAGQAEHVYGLNVRPWNLDAWLQHTVYAALINVGTDRDMAGALCGRVAVVR